LAEKIVYVIVNLSNLTVYVNFSETTSLVTVVFYGYRLASWYQCDATTCDASIS